jgi:hypothetical protein
MIEKRKEVVRMELKSRKVQKTLEKTAKKARKLTGKIANAVSETPEYIALKRNERAIKSEIDEHLLAIGKRVMALHKRAGDNIVFTRYRAIKNHLDGLDQLHEEYRSNRVQLIELRKSIKGKKR